MPLSYPVKAKLLTISGGCRLDVAKERQPHILGRSEAAIKADLLDRHVGRFELGLRHLYTMPFDVLSGGDPQLLEEVPTEAPDAHAVDFGGYAILKTMVQVTMDVIQDLGSSTARAKIDAAAVVVGCRLHNAS